MGLIFPSRRRRRGGVSGAMLLVALGAGSVWMAHHADAVVTQCRDVAQSMGGGYGACDGISRYLTTVASITGGVGEARDSLGSEALNARLDDWQMQFDMSGIRERWAAITHRIDAGQSWAGGNPLGQYVSLDMVRSMLASGSASGGLVGSGNDGQLRAAMNYFTAGQMQMASKPSDALGWYKRGADSGEYGILSQLKLGSLYMSGGEGIVPDLQQAHHYNAQALESLEALQADGGAEADNVLRGLPVEPSQLKSQLQQALERIQGVQ